MNQPDQFNKGLLKENQVLLLMAGTCPALLINSSAIVGLGMGLATTCVLCLSNVVVSAIEDFIPQKVRITASVIIIVSLVTIADLLIQAYIPALFNQPGVFLPLIIVNCLILGWDNVFTFNNSFFSSFMDGLKLGLGFTLALLLIGSTRELLGTGSVFGQKFIAEDADGILVFMLAPGAFILFGFLAAIARKINKKS